MTEQQYQTLVRIVAESIRQQKEKESAGNVKQND